jgi:hypothetical protein
LEYSLENILHKEFAISRTDTWRDLLANTLGAYSLLILIWFLTAKLKLIRLKK